MVTRVLVREEAESIGRGGVCDYTLEKAKQRMSGLC